jgi:hypothetical protein
MVDGNELWVILLKGMTSEHHVNPMTPSREKIVDLLAVPGLILLCLLSSPGSLSENEGFACFAEGRAGIYPAPAPNTWVVFVGARFIPAQTTVFGQHPMVELNGTMCPSSSASCQRKPGNQSHLSEFRVKPGMTTVLSDTLLGGAVLRTRPPASFPPFTDSPKLNASSAGI